MSKTQIDIVFAATAIIIVCLLMAAMSGCKPKLQIGQVWQDEDNPDPFKSDRVVQRKILALRDGYVQYERVDSTCKGIKGSISEHGFRVGASLVLGSTLISNEPTPYPFSGVPIEEPKDSIVIDAATGTARLVIPEPGEFISISTDPVSDAPPVWGKGELPADHQDFFGNDNTARLDYVQNRVLDKHGEILKIIAIRVLALEAVDPNAMRLEALESGMERLLLVEPVE